MWGAISNERTGLSFTEIIVIVGRVIYREEFYFIDRFLGSAHMNFAVESVWLTTDSLRNEGKFFVHRSQGC
jgi:hypothetical protein